jgi:glutathione S-transferase
MLRLVTIPISHYCEKARWALDLAGIPFREERHVQGIHRIATRRAGGGTTAPVLVTPQGALGESADILDWVDERLPAEAKLFPADRADVDALCARFDEVLGVRGRRLMYVHMLDHRDLMLSFNNTGVPRWEDRLLRVAWPLLSPLVSRVLGITPGIEVEDEALVWSELDFVGELLSDERPYLCGERFSAADLTFAALAAPCVVPPEYTVPLPAPEALPEKTAALVRRAREHPAGRHALEMFRRHRRSRAHDPGSMSRG